ncbi:unnamed protein product [Scytosiphon promiscuus]
MMPLTIDPGGECMPTELEKKRAKLEKYKYECSEVADSFLYVSGEDAAKQQGLVGSKGITHIINCAGPQCPNYLEYTGRFNFLRLNFYDHRTEDCAWFMYKAFDFIKAAEQQRGRVLVHCVQGVSRSCTLAIAWLMLTEGVDYDEAYLRVRHGRPICAPNTGFICSLLEWQRRRQQPPSSPLLYRTAWHVPLFPNDLVLKICLHEDDRQHVLPTLAALDSRGCYLLVVPRRRREKNGSGGGPSRTPGIGAAGSSSRTSRATFSTNPSRTSNFALPVVPGGIQTPVANGNGKRSNVAGGSGGSGGSGSGGSDSPAPPVSRAALGRLSTPSPAAARAKAAAAAAVIANAKAVAAVAAAKEAQAVAAAAAAEEAVMVAKAVEAGVAVPWTWRESEVSSRGAPKARLSSGASPPQAAGAARHMVVSDSPTAAVRPSSAPGPRLRPIGVGAGDVEEEEEEGGVDVYVWRGTQSNERMLELAKEGAGWLHDYEGWGVGSSAPVVEEGQETPQVLRHLQSTGDNPREPPVYGDLSSPSPPPTAARTGSSAFMPCPTPSHHGGGGMGRSAPMLSPAETPTLSPAGPSPSPGGVSFSPYGCGVSPAGSTLFGSGQGGAGATISPSGSTAVSPAPSHHKLSIGSGYGAAMGSGYGSGYNPPRCSMASATEEMDEDEEEEEDEHEERVAMGLSPLGEARPAALGAPESGAGGRGGGDIPKLYELADELGGQGTSGLRWSHLAIFDDQDLLPQCCFLLVTPGKQSFLWVGEAFAAGLVQAVSTLQQLQALAKDVAVRDARRKSDRQLPRPSDVETALLVLGDGSEPPEWWSAFESGYT